ncbi:uncharacterized protein LOC119992035 isoform X2 [Tripterygium wilfordii]|uniref:uncharacterized protein LOC119992035 isoform X2 n=2 Tax=Tripterygium wilfordii TaxID=458696 RepID=UPI0018F860CE|nr:uncharacterized protein LOC119992035 isoform X2 [Tripterygium wilfordii]
MSRETDTAGISKNGCSPVDGDTGNQARYSLDKEAGLATCRVCQCAESDKIGDAALGFLGIIPPIQEGSKSDGEVKSENNEVLKDAECADSMMKNIGRDSGFMEFISPEGEVFVCRTDLEMGPCHQQDILVELGCACKNDLGLVHYACALKWFVNHGSTVCEICGRVTKNIRTADFKKVVVSLKDYETLRERTASGHPNPVQVNTSSDVDPDAIAAIRRQRLSEIALWFNPHTNNIHHNSTPSAVSEVVSEQPMNQPVTENAVHSENPATKWVVESTGILLATGLLTVTLAWLIAPHVENCKKWSSYSPRRCLCFNSCDLLSLYCAYQN